MLKLSELQACLSNPLYRVYLDKGVVENITTLYGQVEIQTEQSEQFTFPDQELQWNVPGPIGVMTYDIEKTDGTKVRLRVTLEVAADFNSWMCQFK